MFEISGELWRGCCRFRVQSVKLVNHVCDRRNMANQNRVILTHVRGRQGSGTGHRTFVQTRRRMTIGQLVRTMTHRHRNRMVMRRRRRCRRHSKRHQHERNQRQQLPGESHRDQILLRTNAVQAHRARCRPNRTLHRTDLRTGTTMRHPGTGREWSSSRLA